LDRSDVAVLDIDLGDVIFVDKSADVFDFAMVAWDFHELPSVPHCLSCN
jgi:hypothetical protein